MSASGAARRYKESGYRWFSLKVKESCVYITQKSASGTVSDAAYTLMNLRQYQNTSTGWVRTFSYSKRRETRFSVVRTLGRAKCIVPSDNVRVPHANFARRYRKRCIRVCANSNGSVMRHSLSFLYFVTLAHPLFEGRVVASAAKE